jgi:hypothetical protein
MRLYWVASILLFLGGCAAMQPPTGNDAGYPTGWPSLIGLGDECMNLNGSYENEGVVVDASGASSTLRMTDLLFGGESSSSRMVGFLVSTTRKDPNGDTIGSLQVTTNESLRGTMPRYESFCIKGVLFLA